MTKTRTCKGCNKSMNLIEFAKTGMYDKSGNPYRRYYCNKYGCYWSHKKKNISHNFRGKEDIFFAKVKKGLKRFLAPPSAHQQKKKRS